jgi:putative intracellular protease/amidase
MRALIISADQFEDSELVDPLQSLEEAGREILKKIP